MSYPIMSRAEARNYLVARKADPAGAVLPNPRSSDDGPDVDWEAIVAELEERLFGLMSSNPGEPGNNFEIAAGPEVHKILPAHPALANPEFWIWLAVSHCSPIVEWRYHGKPDLKNFGVGGRSENLLYRLWLRADIGFNPGASDEYSLSRIGDIDFWRSHVFRQGYGDVRAFVRALMAFQFPAADGRKPRLKIVEIRELVKRLKRARSNLMFEVMDEVRAGKFIKSEWTRHAANTQ